MKKKFLSIVLSALMVATLATACGGKSETSAPAAEKKEEAKPEASAPATEAKEEASPEEDTEDEAAPADNSASGDFTLLDVSTDMIDTGVYAISDDGTELVFSMFTEPSGTQMASLFVFLSDGSGDVICGTFEAESETDEDGITWTVLTVSDVYTGNDVTMGFGELDEQVYILDSDTAYEGQYLTADETITYMGTAAALLEAGGTGDSAADAGAAEDFTLLDVTTDMIDTGIYATSDDGTKLVFSIFTEPLGTKMASLFVFLSDGSGDVICGTFASESETDEDGITWTLLTVSDVYTGSEVSMGFGELGEQVYILDSDTAYEGKYLSADETINYMGAAAALIG